MSDLESGEGKPLLSSSLDGEEHKRNGKNRRINFRRQRSRGFIEVPDLFGASESNVSNHMEPIAGLAGLMAGGEKKINRPDSVVKSVPAFAPYCRTKRNRSQGLIYINDFRHWWKLSRLLVRLAGLYVYAHDPIIWDKMVGIKIWKRKGPKRAVKLVKRLGQGGLVRSFLKDVQPFTRFIRIIVASWRYFEASKCRRNEVGMEELMAFMGNRVSRFLSRDVLDGIVGFVVVPIIQTLIQDGYLGKHDWHPERVFIAFGILRAIAPFAASFQGSRLGRVLTRGAFNAGQDRWMAVMRVNDINMQSDDCCEGDEVTPNEPNYDLVLLAKKVAVALGKDSSNPNPSPSRARKYMEEAGFHSFGCGSGGYNVYIHREGDKAVLLHVTPYGPAVFDELPLYVVLEREESVDTRGSWSDTLSQLIFPGSPVVEGYCYKGAFFSPYQFAALKERYDQELLAYQNSCKLMCTTGSGALPPQDLAGLKAFLELGRPAKKIAKHKKREKILQGVADKLCRRIKKMMEAKAEGVAKAPTGVILYFEGLDCAGKSSSGRFVQQALERAGYHVEMRRHNTPPTAADKERPWMARFHRPDDPSVEIVDNRSSGYGALESKDSGSSDSKQFTALVWDRGPAGDFVFGTLAKASEEEKRARYEEFMDFDAKCHEDNILLCKLMFIVDRDSVARTLGKRLAHKVICKDLHTWLDASSGSEGGELCREGLAEIDDHIDKSDFIAFNSYHDNLDKFVNFAKKTDARDRSTWFNPWLVISTTDRNAARFQLLRMFGKQLDRFAVRTHTLATVMSQMCEFLGVSVDLDATEHQLLEIKADAEVELTTFKKNLRLRLRLIIFAMGIVFLLYLYGMFKVDKM